MELFRLKVLPLKRVEHLILNFSVISLNSLSTEQLSIKGISACIICGSTAETVKDPVELSGHTVTVTGYFTGHNGSSGIELQWLEVFDGWNTYPRAINYATPNMVKLNGTVFW